MGGRLDVQSCKLDASRITLRAYARRPICPLADASKLDSHFLGVRRHGESVESESFDKRHEQALNTLDYRVFECFGLSHRAMGIAEISHPDARSTGAMLGEILECWMRCISNWQ